MRMHKETEKVSHKVYTMRPKTTPHKGFKTMSQANDEGGSYK